MAKSVNNDPIKHINNHVSIRIIKQEIRNKRWRANNKWRARRISYGGTAHTFVVGTDNNGKHYSTIKDLKNLQRLISKRLQQGK